MSDIPNRMLAGSLAGFAATAPMTAVMEALYRVLPPHEKRGPLPPREITQKAADAADVADDLSEPQKKGLTGLVHFGFGTGAGAAYGAVAPHLPLGPAANGVAYGLAVWAGSYLGWLPAAGVLPPATEEPAGKNAVMILAHVVWGAALGVLTDRLTGGRPELVRRVPPGRVLL
jgi:uncharacterized membrane protein YagU involved in acid resistance